jgi:hypothetical protein
LYTPSGRRSVEIQAPIQPAASGNRIVRFRDSQCCCVPYTTNTSCHRQKTQISSYFTSTQIPQSSLPPGSINKPPQQRIKPKHTCPTCESTQNAPPVKAQMKACISGLRSSSASFGLLLAAKLSNYKFKNRREEKNKGHCSGHGEIGRRKTKKIESEACTHLPNADQLESKLLFRSFRKSSYSF